MDVNKISLYMQLENANTFKYIGAILTENGNSKKYILIDLATLNDIEEYLEMQENQTKMKARQIISNIHLICWL